MRKTNLAYKTEKKVAGVKTRAPRKSKISEIKVDKKPALVGISNVVSFIMVSKVNLCFRECAKIVKAAEETDCLIEIASGSKSGTTESILSMVNLEIGVDKSLVLTIRGERNAEAFRKVSKILNGTAEEA